MTKTYQPGERTLQQIERTFTYNPPKDDQAPRYVAIRATAKAFAEQLAQQVPESRELSLALTHLEQVVMFANAGIARNE